MSAAQTPIPPSPVLMSALQLARRGFPVFPVHGIRNDVCSCGNECKSPGKHPIAFLAPRGLKDATTDERAIEEWYRRAPYANFGVVTGNGLFVLDIDRKNGGIEAWESLREQAGPIPDTLQVLTGGGGLHLYFQLPPGVRIGNDQAGKLGTGIDWRCDGGYVLVPESQHISGGTYEVDGLTPLEQQVIAPIPPALLARVRRPVERPKTGPADSAEEPIGPGGRHHFLVSQAGRLQRAGLDPEAILAALLVLNRKHCNPPKTDAEVRKVVEDITTRYEKGPQPVASRTAPAALNAADIYRSSFPETRFVVRDWLSTGLTILAGRPKAGKSFLVLQMALAVACDQLFLDRSPVESPGAVAYYALEEPPRRTHDRLMRLLPQFNSGLANIHFVYELAPLMAGGVKAIDEFLTDNPVKLVVVDTLLAAVGAAARREVMRGDYAEVNALRELADKHQTAIVLVHHLRKAVADSGLDAVAGTSGVTAAADAIWTVRKSSSGETVLEITGREMEEKTYGMKFDSGDDFGWHVTSEGDEVGLSDQRQEVLSLLRDEAPCKPAKIALMLKRNVVAMRKLLQRMNQDGLIDKNSSGGYVLAAPQC